MRKALSILIILSICIPAFSQEFKKNEVFIELLGNGLLGSVNYERQLGAKPGLGIRVGAGLYGTDTHMTIPVGVNYLIRVVKNYSFLDLGFGATYTKSDGYFYAMAKQPAGYVSKKEFVYLIPSVGLRSYTTKNYIWKVTVTPFITIGGELLPSAGIGFGKRF